MKNIVIELRNAVFNRHGTIDCELLHPLYGWIPYTASPEDSAAHGPAVWEAAQQMNPGPYVPEEEG